jgi:hypothetical protein
MLWRLTTAAAIKYGDQVQRAVRRLPEPSQPPSQPPSHPAQVSMNPDDWTFKVSDNAYLALPAHGGWSFAFPPDFNAHLSPPAHGGWSVNFPSESTHCAQELVYFESTTASPILTQGQYVKMTGSSPGMDCRMYLQKVSDDLSGQGQYDRWWSTKPLPRPSRLGNFVQFVDLEPEFWSTVTGEPKSWSFVTGERGDASPAATAGFQQALANPQSIGIICAAYVHGDPYAGGVIVYNGNGSFSGLKQYDATFEMDSFAVCDPFADAPSAKQENEACDPPRAP